MYEAQESFIDTNRGRCVSQKPRDKRFWHFPSRMWRPLCPGTVPQVTGNVIDVTSLSRVARDDGRRGVEEVCNKDSDLG